MFIAIPGFILSIIGLLLGIYTIQIYDQTSAFNLAYAILTIFFLIIGFVAMVVGFLLNVIPNMIKKMIR